MKQRQLEALRRQLLARSSPRLQMAVVVGLSGAVAFAFSFALLAMGLRAMAVRYLLSTLVGYAAFLFLIRAWLGWKRRSDALDISDLPDVSGVSGHSEGLSDGGGSFGGGGASGSWSTGGSRAPSLQPSPSSLSSNTGGGGSLDIASALDEGLPVVLAGAAVLAGAVAVGFVIYMAPVLFAEVLLDAAVVGALYRRTRRHDASDWIGGVIRRTWHPALALCLFMAVLGFALQSMAPEEASIGAVLRSFATEQRP